MEKIIFPNNLSFAIREHHATSKHYDLRLECNGIYLSFALPKGPSLNPDVKRLAIEVEPHSLGSFRYEGVIPRERKGAGPVIVWDRGIYYPIGLKDLNKETQQYLVRDSYLNGCIRFTCIGKKINGSFEFKKVGDKRWLLCKLKDKYVSKADVTLLNRSVVSGLTINDIRKGKSLRHLTRDNSQIFLF